MSNVIEFPGDEQVKYEENRKQMLLGEIDILRQEVEQGYIVNLGIISTTASGESDAIVSTYEQLPALYMALEQAKQLVLALEFDEG